MKRSYGTIGIVAGFGWIVQHRDIDGGEVLGMQRVWLEQDALSNGEILRPFGLALLIHVALFFALYLYVPSKPSAPLLSAGASSSLPVRVHLEKGSWASVPTRSPQLEPLMAPAGRTSPSAPKIPLMRRTPAAVSPSAPSRLEPEVPLAQTAETQPPVEEPLPLPTSASTFFPQDARLSKYLPSGSSDYRQHQQEVGYESGRDHEEREDFLPLPDAPEKLRNRLRPPVVTTEFSTLAYRMQLERRFAEAWGGIRYLPYGASFAGKTGELIVYNVIVNRDGTLRRIVNVSALEQGERDFSAVDRLVQEFADSVFPLNPLPDRIRAEPFIVRWPIRYGGLHYSFF